MKLKGNLSRWEIFAAGFLFITLVVGAYLYKNYLIESGQIIQKNGLLFVVTDNIHNDNKHKLFKYNTISRKEIESFIK